MSKILIVEDEEAIADLERDYLELSGFTVEVANDGDTGLQKALNEDYDLLILDLMLPGTDGFDICRQVRDVKNTPIVMVSAKKDDIDKIRGLGLGADDYITKPFSAAYLKARIFNLLEQRKKLQALYCASLLPASTEQPLAGKKETTTPALSPNDRKFMDKVMETIEKHLDNGDLTVEDIAGEVNMSRSVFFKKLKTLTGLSPVEFLKEIRMKRAAQLIETEEYNMAQIAYMVGLNDSHYFSKCFKQQYGMTPTEYKESRKQNT